MILIKLQGIRPITIIRLIIPPNNSFLVLVGELETDKIFELVKKYYGAIPKGTNVPDLVCFEEPQKVRKTF